MVVEASGNAGGAWTSASRSFRAEAAAKPSQNEGASVSVKSCVMVRDWAMVGGVLVFIVAVRVVRSSAALCELEGRKRGHLIYRSPAPRNFATCSSDGANLRRMLELSSVSAAFWG